MTARLGHRRGFLGELHLNTQRSRVLVVATDPGDDRGGRADPGAPGFIPGKAGVDYPDFRSIPATDFTCENFILPGFYADTFTSCQVKI